MFERFVVVGVIVVLLVALAAICYGEAVYAEQCRKAKKKDEL